MTNIISESVNEISHAKQESINNNMFEENTMHIETVTETNHEQDANEMRKEQAEADTPRENNSCQDCETDAECDNGSEMSSEDNAKSLSTDDKMNSEGKETHMGEPCANGNKKRVQDGEAHTLHEDGDVSRQGSICSQSDKNKLKKKTRILSRFKINAYLHKSYDKVSHALMKTSKSLLKPGNTTDCKSEKVESTDNVEMFNTLNSEEFDSTEENILTEDELCLVNKYLEDKQDIDEKNKEILNEFNLFLKNQDSSNFMNELNDLLNERKLLIKSVNHFKNLSKRYNNYLEKYKDSYYILNLENEQLNENIKTFKSCIENMQKQG